jgi:uncharacterized protein (TIGR00255 family)
MKSMTGFGKAVTDFNGKKINIEIRSVNSKQLDLNLRMASLYRDKEQEIRSELSKNLERGKIDVSIYYDVNTEASANIINTALAKVYHAELKKIASELGENNNELMPLVLKMPDIFKGEKLELNTEEYNTLTTLLKEAIDSFNKFRNDEGLTLKKEFTQRINAINQLLSDVITLDSKRIPNVRERLRKNIDELKSTIDENRFEQELIYYIEKLDIAEEKLRLKTHLDYFTQTMEEAASGRKLGFISQEIGREINTIGSKANDAGIQKLVVQMKDELEKIKEQLLNVL